MKQITRLTNEARRVTVKFKETLEFNNGKERKIKCDLV